MLLITQNSVTIVFVLTYNYLSGSGCRRVVYRVHDTAAFFRKGEVNVSFFPMFIELEGVSCLVVGGGGIAQRKVMVLCDFGALVTVVAPEICPELCHEDRIEYCCRNYVESDLQGRYLVVAATDDADLNHRISQDCRDRGILVNAVDQPDDCDFIFPSYLKKGDVVAAFSSGGRSPVVTQYLKQKNEPLVTDTLGQLAECLGALRQLAKKKIRDPKKRKNFYEKLLQLGLAENKIPEETEIQNMVKEMEKDGPYETTENECNTS